MVLVRNGFLVLIFVSCTTPVLAQNLGSIVGAVRDQNGTAIPGATVEASSPALIEGKRSTVSGGNGEYRIIDLRPGNYAVTFTHEGFRTVRQENVGVGASNAVTLNEDLQLGQTAQTLTVTDAPPW